MKAKSRPFASLVYTESVRPMLGDVERHYRSWRAESPLAAWLLPLQPRVLSIVGESGISDFRYQHKLRSVGRRILETPDHINLRVPDQPSFALFFQGDPHSDLIDDLRVVTMDMMAAAPDAKVKAHDASNLEHQDYVRDVCRQLREGMSGWLENSQIVFND